MLQRVTLIENIQSSMRSLVTWTIDVGYGRSIMSIKHFSDRSCEFYEWMNFKELQMVTVREQISSSRQV